MKTNVSISLTDDERNILSVAFKNVVGTRRTAWRVLHSIESKEGRRGNEENKTRASNYREKVEGELRSFCREILRIIDNDLLPKVSSRTQSYCKTPWSNPEPLLDHNSCDLKSFLLK